MNEKHHNLQVKIGAILGYVNYIVKMVIQLLYVPIMLRYLDQNEYGAARGDYLDLKIVILK